MCKQEDYFKKIDLHAQQKIKYIIPCHASTGRPKPCRALGSGEKGGGATTEHSRCGGSKPDWRKEGGREGRRRWYLEFFLKGGGATVTKEEGGVCRQAPPSPSYDVGSR